MTPSERLASVRDIIADSESKAGRTPGCVRLVAVSKTQPAESVQELLADGQTLFGENRVQEARAKIPLVGGRAEWHLIGPLQKNKIRHALPIFTLLHGVDSLETAEQIHRIAGEMGLLPRVLLEVNIAGEASKHGFLPDTLEACIESLIAMDRLQIEGLMCIPPFRTEAEESRPDFIRLRELRDRLETEYRIGLPELSMGMSGDYPVAISEGATYVRVGSAVFGERKR